MAKLLDSVGLAAMRDWVKAHVLAVVPAWARSLTPPTLDDVADGTTRKLYMKPAGGIPASDLAESVQEALGGAVVSGHGKTLLYIDQIEPLTFKDVDGNTVPHADVFELFSDTKNYVEVIFEGFIYRMTDTRDMPDEFYFNSTDYDESKYLGIAYDGEELVVEDRGMYSLVSHETMSMIGRASLDMFDIT